MKTQKGFTLIELIVVIVILGILAATAMPKFLDVQTNARTSAVMGVKGSMDSAASLAHAAMVVAGTASNVAVTLGGTSIAMSNGYPTQASILTAANISSTDFDTTTAGEVRILNSPTPANCKATYAASVSGATPSTGTAVTGC